MRFLLAIFPALMGSATISANTSQFDLKCTGIEKLYDNGRKSDGPFSRTFHVDLSRGEYCVDDCSAMKRLQDVDSLLITFSDEDNHGGALNARVRKERVDRRTGKYEMAALDVSTLKHGTATGICEAAPFTPFPTTKF